MKKLFLFLSAVLLSTGLWADVTFSYTGYSTQIANGWTHDYGNTYVGRKGSNYTPESNGLPTGNSNIFAAFQVTEKDSIKVIFVWTKTNGDLSGKSIALASISKDTYDKLALASTATTSEVKYSISDFSSIKSAAVAINRSDANKDITIKFDTAVLAGYYAVYTASSINASALIKSIKLTPAPSNYKVTYNGNGSTSGSVPTDNTAYAKNADVTVKGNTGSLEKTGYSFSGWNNKADGTGANFAVDGTFKITQDTTLYAKWTAETYTVTLHTNDGTINSGDVTSYTYGVGATLPTDVTKTNKDFMGWYANEGLTGDRVYTIADDATGNKEFWAKWQDAATKYAISYNEASLKGQSVSGYPTQYTEGIGIASFEDLNDVTNFHFNGWSPASISAEDKGDKEITATWVASYNVTFSAGDGSGTVPASFQKWAGATFNLPGQGSMTAPTGKVFAGWKANGAGAKLAAESEYTMGSAAVEFVAQWKGVKQTIFLYQQSNLDANLAAGTYTATGGSITTSAEMSKESAIYNAAVPTDLKGGGNVGKFGSNAVYVQLTLTSGNFQEGDTVYICGYNPYKISSTSSLTGDIVDSIATGTGKKDYNVGYAIIPDGISQSSIYLSRQQGTGTGFAAVKVIRPAAREIASTVISLSDVKVNNRSIHADSLAILKTGPAYSLTLKDSYTEAPVIKFNQQKVITYADGESPATKTTNKVYTVTASLVDGKWQAQQTINEITYTVTAAKPSTYSVVYKDGNKTLDTEVVIVGEHPAGITDPTKAINTFAGWKNGDDDVDPTELDGTKDQVITLQAQWTKLYATNIDFEAFIDDKGTSGKWDSLLTANNYAISSTNSVSLDAPAEKPADKGLKIKKSGTIVSFNVHAGKMVVLKTGVLSGAQISVDGGANYTDLTSASGSTGASVVSYHYNAAEATYMIKMTTDAYNIIQSISITDPFTVSCSNTTNGSISADTLKARPNETITLTVTPDSHEYRITGVTVDGEALVADQGVYSFAMPAKNVTVAATFAEKEAAPISWSAATGKAYLPVGAKASVLPSLTNESSLTVAYSSTDEAKATIDASTGVITPVATGATTIKATYTATAEGAYKTTVAEYTLNVYGVKSMAISGDATVTEYAKNDAFDFAGLTATATFDDDETEDVTGVAEWLADPATITEAGNVNVTASLGGKTSAAKVVAVTITATGFDNIDADAKAVKVLENGMLIIEKNGVRYNAQGQVLR